MSLSVLYFTNNFQPSSGNDYRIQTAQASDAEEMARVYSKNLAEIVAVNAGIQNPQDQFTPVDAMLAGGGDGHTFIYSVTFTRVRLAAAQQLLLGQQVLPVTPAGPVAFPGTGFPLPTSATNNPTLGAVPQPTPIPTFFVDPQLFVTKFAIASSQEEIQAAHNKVVSDIIAEVRTVLPTSPGVYCPFQGIAGAAKGTRFMIAVSGVPMIPPVGP